MQLPKSYGQKIHIEQKKLTHGEIFAIVKISNVFCINIYFYKIFGSYHMKNSKKSIIALSILTIAANTLGMLNVTTSSNTAIAEGLKALQTQKIKKRSASDRFLKIEFYYSSILNLPNETFGVYEISLDMHPANDLAFSINTIQNKRGWISPQYTIFKEKDGKFYRCKNLEDLDPIQRRKLHKLLKIFLSFFSKKRTAQKIMAKLATQEKEIKQEKERRDFIPNVAPTKEITMPSMQQKIAYPKLFGKQ